MPRSPLAQVARFCVGSDSYRSAHRDAFAADVGRLPAEDLESWLVESHLTGLFCAAAQGPQHAPRTVARRLEARHRLEVAYHRHLLAEVGNLAARLGENAPAIAPVLIKGVAHWAFYADGPGERRVRDLDLYAPAADTGARLCDALEREGFQSLHFESDERNAREHLAAGEAFSAPPYRLRRRLDLDEIDAAWLRAQAEGRAHAGVELAWLEEVGAVATVDVEIHLALFRTEDGRLVRAPDASAAPGPAPGLATLRPGVGLAYAGVKGSLDLLEAIASAPGHAKALKLAGDLVRILQTCRQDDFEAAFACAQAWGCLHHFVEALRGVAPLAPELALENLPGGTEPSLVDVFLDRLASPASVAYA